MRVWILSFTANIGGGYSAFQKMREIFAEGVLEIGFESSHLGELFAWCDGNCHAYKEAFRIVRVGVSVRELRAVQHLVRASRQEWWRMSRAEASKARSARSLRQKMRKSPASNVGGIRAVGEQGRFCSRLAVLDIGAHPNDALTGESPPNL
jgi:glutamate mutase epsilon subunit